MAHDIVPDKTVWSSPGKIGKGARFDTVNKVEAKHNYNGSGPKAFGGARQWPVVECHVGFQTGEEELASEFATDLGKFIDRWLVEHSREGGKFNG